jgi:hypothetical protein
MRRSDGQHGAAERFALLLDHPLQRGNIILRRRRLRLGRRRGCGGE